MYHLQQHGICFFSVFFFDTLLCLLLFQSSSNSDELFTLGLGFLYACLSLYPTPTAQCTTAPLLIFYQLSRQYQPVNQYQAKNIQYQLDPISQFDFKVSQYLLVRQLEVPLGGRVFFIKLFPQSFKVKGLCIAQENDAIMRWQPA